MRLLALDAALGPCSGALLVNGVTVGHIDRPDRRATANLPLLVEGLLSDFPGALDAVAVTVGPGSFTGLRAALALAHGIGLGADIPVIGVTVAEAIAEQVSLSGALWVALDTRRGRVFLVRGDAMGTFELDDLPRPDGPVSVAGDAAGAVTAALGPLARACDVTGVTAQAVGLVALRRLKGALPPCPAQPLYVDPPAARAAAALRPPPA